MRTSITQPSGGGASAPAGAILAYGGATAPNGWLLCDGAAVSRTTYADLFAAIGTAFGVGDGSTTFNLPNTKGRVLAGKDAAQTEFDVLGKTGGAKTHTLTIAEMPAHSHNVTAFSSANGGASPASHSATSSANWSTDAAGGGAAHNNLQPYLTISHIIKT